MASRVGTLPLVFSTVAWVNWNLKLLEESVAARLFSEKQNIHENRARPTFAPDSRVPLREKTFAAVG